MLELAWYEKDITAEMKAYGNMSREHFYLGDMDKAYYYHDRMIRGKAENGKSALKSMSFHIIKNKREAKNEKNANMINNNKDRFKNHALPSPRESNKTNNKIIPTIDILPHYFVGEDLIFREAMKNHRRLLKGGLYGIEEKRMQKIDTEKMIEENKKLKGLTDSSKLCLQFLKLSLIESDCLFYLILGIEPENESKAKYLKFERPKKKTKYRK